MLLWCSTRDVDPWPRVVGPVLWIPGDVCDVRAVDPSCQVGPEPKKRYTVSTFSRDFVLYGPNELSWGVTVARLLQSSRRRMCADLLILDQPREPVDRILIQPRLVQHNLLPPILLGQRQLLQEIAEHVCSADIEAAVATRGSGAKRDGLRAMILDGNLDVVVRVFAREERLEGVVDVDEVAARGVTLGVWPRRSVWQHRRHSQEYGPTVARPSSWCFGDAAA